MTVLIIMTATIQAQEHKAVTQHTKSALDTVYPCMAGFSLTKPCASSLLFFRFTTGLSPRRLPTQAPRQAVSRQAHSALPV